MEKRYQVFVSSTYVDLAEERLEVIKALLELDCIPCGMEYFPAASEDSWSYISSLIDQCDYYIVIVGGRYGSLAPDGVSFTQKEYLYALSNGIPAVAFLHAKPEELPAKKTEQNEEGKRKLTEFLSLLRKNPCKDWVTSHELGAVASRSITQLIRRYPRNGWIPANQAGDPKAAQELLDLTKKVAELEAQLKSAKAELRPNISDLADQDDMIELSVKVDICQESQKITWARHRIVAQIQGAVSISWNELFRAVAPKIAPIANDEGIRSAINGLLKDHYRPEAKKIKEGQMIGAVKLTENSFNIIRVQFVALGLVTVAKERHEGGSLSNIRWRLTEIGEARMLHSIAIKKHTKKKAAKSV